MILKRALIERMAGLALRGGDWLWACLRVLLVGRISVLAAAAVLVVLAVPAQVRESLEVMAHDLSHENFAPQLLTGLLATICGLTLWYWARVLLVQSNCPPANAPSGAYWLATWAPRFAGMAPWLGLALAIAPMRQSRDLDWQQWDTRFFLGALLMAALMLAAFISRRYWLQRFRGQSEFSARTQTRLLHLALVASLGVALACWIAPTRAAPAFGAVALLLAATTLYVAVLSRLGQFSLRTRFPFLSLLLAWPLLLAALDANDNHWVRTLPGTPTVTPSFDAAALQWLRARQAGTCAGTPDQPIPVIIVAAEGGGIRAAYFTSQILARMQDADPCFARQVFAISGVSGGSLGGADFVAELSVAPTEASLSRRVSDTFANDLLAPVVATALFADLWQKWLPASIVNLPNSDRAASLEAAFEHHGAPGLAASLHQPLVDRPWLLMNTTSVETGTRVVAAPVRLDAPQFSKVRSFAQIAPDLDMRLSTAAVLSARFTYVTPAGSAITQTIDIKQQPASIKARFVDGGYYDNSGILTAVDTLRALQQVACDAGIEIAPMIVRISNSPKTWVGANAHKSKPWLLMKPHYGFGETLSPLRTVMESWDERSDDVVQALNSMATLNGKVDLAEFFMGDTKEGIPLGWQLSRRTRNTLDEQLLMPVSGSPALVGPGAEPPISSEVALVNCRAFASVLGHVRGKLVPGCGS